MSSPLTDISERGFTVWSLFRFDRLLCCHDDLHSWWAAAHQQRRPLSHAFRTQSCLQSQAPETVFSSTGVITWYVIPVSREWTIKWKPTKWWYFHWIVEYAIIIIIIMNNNNNIRIYKAPLMLLLQRRFWVTATCNIVRKDRFSVVFWSSLSCHKK